MACKHFPRSIENRCLLCNPEAVYSINSYFWNDGIKVNEPIIEILRNGDVWASPWDTNFRFGRIKAAMILYCIDNIQGFALAPESGKLIPSPIIHQPDPDLIIQLQTFPAFTKMDGVIVDEPYLRLDRIGEKYSSHIGFGQRKAAALVILKKDIKNWLKSVHGWYRG
jgi:hypothetical protein